MHSISKDNSYVALIKGKQVTFKHTGASVMPAFKDVTSVSVIPFTKDGQIVAVRLRHRGIDIPGGHVEPDETTPEQTMEREVMEEACITIHRPMLVEVIESDYFDHPSYMLLYAAFVDELHEFTSPEEEMSDGREIVDQEEFIKQYEAGDKGLMRLAIKNAWQQLQGEAPHDIPVYTIHLPEYQVTTKPDYKVLGRIVDDELKKHFMGQMIGLRALGSQEHPGRSINELVEIIKRDGTDRYDPERGGDRYDNTENKHIDLFLLRRKISDRSKIFWQLAWSFYESPLKLRGQPVRVDILVIYDLAKLKAVRTTHIHEGYLVTKQDGFVFKEPNKKNEAVFGIIKVEG